MKFGDIDWRSITEEEIKATAAISSYDHDEFAQRMDNHDEWVKIIIAHIYIDHILNQMISESLARPDAIINEKRRKYVLDKLEICLANGLISDALFTIITKINSLRNTFAHNLNFSVSAKQKSGLVGVFHESANHILEEIGETNNEDFKDVSFILKFTVALLDFERQTNLKNKYTSIKGQVALRDAINNARKVLAEPWPDPRKSLGKTVRREAANTPVEADD
ncbi:hypothetical protein [Phyllobacterium sp. 22552]|uniref:hypothetical protein n=1 Tax=Phyllobacterium sp. 22552 TaxID=3453941 RepID=UPI003F84F0F5